MSKRFDPVEAGLALLSGGAGGPWRARAERLALGLLPVMGHGYAGFEALPLERPERALSSLAPTQKNRVDAEATARAVVESLGRRRFKRLEPRLGEDVWVLWPNGHLARFARADVIAELDSRRGETRPFELAQIKTYARGELQSALARGLPDALDAVLGLGPGRLLVTGRLIEPELNHGRVAVVVERVEGEDGWRAVSLPLPGFDAAHVAKKKSSYVELENRFVAEQIVHRLVLGHAAHLEALLHLVTPQLYLGDTLVPAEALVALAGQGQHKLQSTDVVLLGSTTAPIEQLDRLLPGGAGRRVRSKLPDLFREAIHRLNPELVLTALGTYDPSNDEIRQDGGAICVVVRTEEELGRRRFKVCGVFV